MPGIRRHGSVNGHKSWARENNFEREVKSLVVPRRRPGQAQVPGPLDMQGRVQT